MFFTVLGWAVIALLALVFFIIGALEWSRNQLHLDFLDFYKHSEVDEALSVARNKFLDQVRLFAWEIRRSTDSEREKTRAERIFESRNDDFDEWRFEKGEMCVELITAEYEEEIEVEEISLTVPKHMKWRVFKLFAASRFLRVLLE